MLRKIKFLQSICQFDEFDWDRAMPSTEFAKLTLIYAENGRGKTTLAAVLRSLTTGESLPIAERARLGATKQPKAILECVDDATDTEFKAIYRDAGWNQVLKGIKIFDDAFIDENVYSGLNVDSSHRQHLHDLILGEHGVNLARNLDEIGERINQHNKALHETSAVIQMHISKELDDALPLAEFCALHDDAEVDSKIEASERELRASRNLHSVVTASDFQELNLPDFDLDNISRILSADLPSLDEAAEGRVKEHIEQLGAGGEQWLSDGTKFEIGINGKICPFCGQDVDGSLLLAHYRAYFSAGYENLKREITGQITEIEQAHATGTMAVFERAVHEIENQQRFWSQYVQTALIDIDAKGIVRDWSAAKEALINQLLRKQNSPLEPQELEEKTFDAIRIFRAHKDKIVDANAILTSTNEQIKIVKNQAQTSDADAVAEKINWLKAVKLRHSPIVADLCSDYVQEQKAKSNTESKRRLAQQKIHTYRSTAFPKLQENLNKYLRGRFNTGFRIDSITPTNPRGRTSCTYDIAIDGGTVPVSSENIPPGTPAFRNTLSAGDRTSLALGLFLSSLDQDSLLHDRILVIDDPISSLDEHRVGATIERIALLAKEARQVFVLSHDRHLLCEIWAKSDKSDTAAFEIIRSVNNSSVLRTWSLLEYTRNEHDKRHVAFRKYLYEGVGEQREMARDLRLHIEYYLRAACPGALQPGQPLGGEFLAKCQNSLNTSEPILSSAKLQELRGILNYAHKFHHDTNPGYMSVDINDGELMSYIDRTLKFATP